MNKMDPERWQKIESLYNSALDLEPSQREAFLTVACEGNDSLRKAVKRLLEHHGEAEDFIEFPAVEVLTEMKTKERSSLLGMQLGSYQVISELGRGGMGEVYQARDRKLGRDVAIKVLPEEFAKDADRVARFEREAKLLASLNHPNIASIYGLEESSGFRFLILEFVRGETLADRIKRGPIPMEETLSLALQIAEALESAHERGVIHRDLKPSNIKVTPDNRVKVLDFGLAKAFARDQGEMILSDSPTISAANTQEGLILGTAAYMSPEQARGRVVDKRTDVWAFGCVLYEMLTGCAAFSGEDVSEILAAVIRGEPVWDRLPANLHWRLREAIERCLDKEARNRYSGINDARVDIQKVLSDPTGVYASPVGNIESSSRFRAMLLWITTTLVLTTIIVGALVWNLKPPERHPEIQFRHELLEGQQIDPSPESGHKLAVSADGNHIVYSANDGLYLRSLNELDARRIVGADEKPRSPFFSPDGQMIGYWSETDQQLKTIPIGGGTPTVLCSVKWVLGASWCENNTILFAEAKTGIKSVSAKGGIPELLVKGPSAFPTLLPGGKSILYTDIRALPSTKIMIQSLESGAQKELFQGTGAKYLPTGHLVYKLGNDLFGIPFDLATLEVTGDGIPIVYGAIIYAISESGTLIYASDKGSVEEERILVWVSRDGTEELTDAPPKNYGIMNLSPDGTRVASAVGDSAGNIDVHIWNFNQKSLRQLTFTPYIDGCPVWNPDGKRIAFRSNRKGGPDGVYLKSADGGGNVELIGYVPKRTIFPSSWSNDGKTLVLEEYGGTSVNVGILSLGKNQKYRQLLMEDFEETSPQISPNGRWLAYCSDESGQNEIYVCSFPDVSKNRRKISTDGGTSIRWSRDGKELFYRNGDSTMAVPVKTEGPIFEYGSPEILFSGSYGSSWDVGPNGKFLMTRPAESADRDSKAESPGRITVIVNWLQELKERVPMK